MIRREDVHALDLGTVRFPEGHPDRGTSGVIQAFAVSTWEGVILIDTGIGVGSAEVDEYFQPNRIPLGEALANSNLGAKPLAAVIVSHLHFDHAGSLSVVRPAPVHVQRAELEAANEPDYTVPAWVNRGDIRYVPHDGDYDVAPHVHVIATPGHTPGHQSVAVETEEGLVLLACQAVYTLEEWDPGVLHPAGGVSAWDEEVYRSSLERLRTLDPVEVRFSHDVRVWNRAPRPRASAP